MFERVLLCQDGSDAGRVALKRGAELAIYLNAKVFVLSIVSDAAFDAASNALSLGYASVVNSEVEYRRSLEESVGRLKARGVEAEGFLARGNTIDTIVEYSKRLSIDLIVVGHYPKPAGGRWWSGPERAALAERVSCSVLIAMGQ
jgi:nucleotide-binding universal stress UspA family protein